MAELKDLFPFTKELSLLYIDENQELLTSVVTALKKVFLRVDDANNATLGIGYLKVHQYDIVVVDTTSSIMDAKNLVKNIRLNSNFQEIILTTKDTSSEHLLSLYKYQTSYVLTKPFNTENFLDSILTLSKKLKHARNFLQDDINKLNEDLKYERKRIGRSMMKEKKLQGEIENYKNSVHINKNIYELTRLPSRHALQDMLDGREQSAMYLNIDHFDFINTTYGMGKANKLLKESAIQLSRFLPTNAQLFHITADEFVILLTEPTLDQPNLLGQQVQAFFKESPIDFDEYSHNIIFSIGIDNGKGKKLFINSKAASKEARYYGGNQIVTYDIGSSYMQEQRDSLHWIEILKKAFNEDKILTYYQPIISNLQEETKHYEVLCRLIDDNGRLVDAYKFIKSAKQVGLITQITRLVIDKTFKVFKDNDYNFSINISMHDLHEDYLFTFLNYKCDRYNIAPSRVHLEIVEDIIINKSEELDKQILGLKNMGYHVILDDFGTDKAAYNRMFDLKAEFIKIDGTFIKKLYENKEYQLIVKNIVDFSKKSGIKTIAEHVESQEIFDIVKELGVDYSQGFFIGEPSVNL